MIAMFASYKDRFSPYNIRKFDKYGEGYLMVWDGMQFNGLQNWF